MAREGGAHGTVSYTHLDVYKRQFTIGGQPAYANLRGYWEFEANNRVEGYAMFATLVVPLGSGK